ncbi:unnamed protein product [Didymodactylos carnosus]|uniref:C2H2-type domain-containing protein n=1 Tax=Didymodactylos carnosus TaxID=1234261 RepID=A0A814CEC4_9BILA|nr:unnamed protein product [Didymodactylos carnosus]CAF0939068.1 unnamed protein product [Didymodactylos carnosus]CAF3627538.1 unnamed protein product [Didymodactylos carnosus]CAF3715924.1 unnamed protein product [Didymodactylos carnosus]
MHSGYHTSTVSSPNRAVPGLGFDTNYLYLNQLGPTANMPSGNRQYAFQKRNERVDWRRIAAFDVDRIAREMDFQALQENLEQITLCNIDAEVNTRAIDPNFVKLFKMAQMTIEYLLLCQDQISAQLGEVDQIKSKGFLDSEDAKRQIEKLKIELNDVKKESKKRRRMLETQQNMLAAQNYNYHVCPVCSRAFLNSSFLQAHIERRHAGVNIKKREHDIDFENELQRLKEQINKKEQELLLLRVSKDEIQAAQKKLEELNEKYLTLRTSGHGSPQHREAGVTELIKENKSLQAEIDSLKQTIQQMGLNHKKQEEKLIQKHQREIENYKKTIKDLNDTINMLKNSQGSDSSGLIDKLTKVENHYHDERLRRKELEDKLKEADYELSQLKNRPPPMVTERKIISPTPTLISRNRSPTPSLQPQQQRDDIRSKKTTIELYLRRYCDGLVKKLEENPMYLHNFRDDARKQFIDELEDKVYLGILETDTCLSDLDYKMKMKRVFNTRVTIRQELPRFDSIRDDISSLLDKYVSERMEINRTGNLSMRSSGGKLVTFEGGSRQNHPQSYIPSINTTSVQQKDGVDDSSYHQHRLTSTLATVQPKIRYDHSKPPIQQSSSTVSKIVRNLNTYNESQEDDVTLSNATESNDGDTSPTRPSIDRQPSPRKNVTTVSHPTISSLVTSNMRPSTTRERAHKSESNNWQSDSDSESSRPTTGITNKTKIIEKHLKDSRSNGQKPLVNTAAISLRTNSQTLATQNDDSSDSSLTTLSRTDQNRVGDRNGGHLPKISGREGEHQMTTNNPFNSSADMSHNTYDDLWKSLQKADKGAERRPPTADSAKTSNIGSDVDNLDAEDY